jgi:hypothetical protein
LFPKGCAIGVLKQRKGKDYKSGHFIAKCPYTSESDRDDDKKGKKKMEKKRYYKKKGGEAHMWREWDSDESSTDSSFDGNGARRRRYILKILPNTLHLMMRVALVMIMMN